MNYKILINLIFLPFSLLSQTQTHQSNHLISISQFELLADSSYTLIDLRKPEEFKKGHILNAINLWRTHIVDSTLEIGGMKISRDSLQNLFSKNGVKSTNKIVIYDAKGNVDAARLWWILFNYGHKNCALLNGGLTEWELQNKPISTREFVPKQTHYTFPNQPDSSLIISFADMQKMVKDSNVIVLDTRTFDEFVGNIQKKGAYRKGRIPNSILIDWAEGVNYNGNMKFRSINDLKTIYNFNNAPKNQAIVTYCQSGVRSAHTTFILTQLLGFTNVKNYDGSWIEWSYHSDLPIETGEVESIQTQEEPKQDLIPWLFILCPILLLALGILLVYRKK